MLISRRRLFPAVAGTFWGATTKSNAKSESIARSFVQPGERVLSIGLFNPFGYAIARDHSYPPNPYSHGYPDWQTALPIALLKRLQSFNVGCLRLCVDPGPLLAATSERTIDDLISQILECVTAIIEVGIRCYIDVHVQPSWFSAVPGWGDRDLIDGVDGPKFQRLVAVERRLAQRLNGSFDFSKVALELFNEPPKQSEFIGKTPWPVQLKHLFDAVRQVAPKLTVIVSGADFGNPSALAQLDPASFDANTLFSFHNYEPYTFTFQSLTGDWIGGWNYLPYITRLPFPPDEFSRTDAIARMTMAVQADNRLNFVERQIILVKGRSALADYFDRPQGRPFIAAIIRRATQWADSHGLPRNRLLLGEFGAWGDSEKGADQASKVRYYSTVVDEAKKAGIGWNVHELEDPSSLWRITDASQDPIKDYMDALQFE
jgi:endoglucanase